MLSSIKAEGQDYHEVLAELHRIHKPQWYLEVGTQTGKSLLHADCKCVSVDPQYKLRHEVIGTKENLFFFQQTSDEFFHSQFLSKLDVQIDLAFLDGMHLYEFLLRDFYNAEQHMAPSGKIIMHDCLPYEKAMADRDRSTRAWTGDVWKIVPILKENRPDLHIEIIDAAPTGLVVVNNLDPTNNMLQSNYSKIVQKYNKITDVEKYVLDFSISSTSKYLPALNDA